MSSHLGGHRCVFAWVCSNQGKLHKNLVVGIPEHEWRRNTNEYRIRQKDKEKSYQNAHQKWIKHIKIVNLFWKWVKFEVSLVKIMQMVKIVICSNIYWNLGLPIHQDSTGIISWLRHGSIRWEILIQIIEFWTLRALIRSHKIILTHLIYLTLPYVLITSCKSSFG